MAHHALNKCFALTPAEVYHHMPHAATRMAYTAVFLLSVACSTVQKQAWCSQLPHMHDRLRACFTSSARLCASAAARRCSAAASASARASVRAWRTWAQPLDQQGNVSRTGISLHCSSTRSSLPTLPRAWHVPAASFAVWCAHSAQKQARAVQRTPLSPHMHSKLRACLTSSTRWVASAAAMRCSAAASASARASAHATARAWCT